ncbi:MAG: guanine deaminase [Haliangiales bacterium]
MTTVYRAAILHALSSEQLEYLPRGELVVDNDGVIVALGRAGGGDVPAGAPRVDYTDKLVIPGLVDAHVHLPQIDIIGVASESLLDWLHEYVFPSESDCADPDVARDRARRSFRAMLAAGTTACAAYSSSHTRATEIAFEEADRCGIRAVIGKVLMDRGAPAALLQDPAPALADTAALIDALADAWRPAARGRWLGPTKGRLAVAVTPRFALSCSPALLTGAGDLARRTGVHVQTHLAENASELSEVARLFPAQRDYTSVYAHHGLVGARSLLAHCIHLSDAELDHLAGARATAVHCPDSNFYLHSGRFELARVRERGVSVALGSDVGAGTCHSIVEAMRLANYAQPQQVPPALLFYLATLGGARALGWGDRIGNLEVGKQADFTVLEADSLPLRDLEQLSVLLSRLVHRGRSALVRAVYVGGVRRYERGMGLT